MNSAGRRSEGGLLEGLYGMIKRRGTGFALLVLAGAFSFEWAIDYRVRKLREYNNLGDISVSWERPSEE